jgi:hypothetical protein
MKTLTPRMLRDTLALQGPKSLGELAEGLTLTEGYERNVIQAMLLDLAAAGEVDYDYDTGTWRTDLVLS